MAPPLLTAESADINYESGCYSSTPLLKEQCIASSYDEGSTATVEAQMAQLTAKYKSKKVKVSQLKHERMRMRGGERGEREGARRERRERRGEEET